MDSIELRKFDMKKIQQTNVCAFVAQRNSGKCLAKGTEVLMFDGSVKKIEDIVKGEFVMGDDSTKRTVMGTTSGVDTLFEIENLKGDKYAVNSHHILSLKYDMDRCVDIPILEYLNLSISQQKKLLGYQVPIEFKVSNNKVNPYDFGYWIGEKKLIVYKIPYDFIRTTRKDRMKFLAGVMDAGNYDGYAFNFSHEILLDDIIFLCKSLGFLCVVSIEDNVYRIHINGDGLDEIPIKNGIQVNLRFSKTSVLLDEIKVKSVGQGEYYGFELDGNHRFVLGNFIVSHNSFLMRDLMFYQQDIPAGLVVSKTDRFTQYYAQFIPPVLIHDEYSSEIIDKLFDRQKKAIKENWPNPHAFLIFDDVVSDAGVWKRDGRIKELFFNGRHYKLMFLVALQDPLAITPGLRSNIDFTFILRTPNQRMRRSLYENYCGMFPSYEIFEKVLESCTENYGCIVIDNTTKSNKLEDQVFFYKASEHPPFRICSQNYWMKKKPIQIQDSSITESFMKNKRKLIIKKTS